VVSVSPLNIINIFLSVDRDMTISTSARTCRFAVVYAKAGRFVTIVPSKSRVNPIKNRKIFPKLELCAAPLLSKLIQKVKESIDNPAKIYA